MESEEITEAVFLSEQEIIEFIEEEIDKKSELQESFKEKFFLKKTQFIKTIMKCIDTSPQNEKENKHSAGYIYAFQSLRSLDKDERPFTIKIGATVDTHTRILWWKSTDQQKYTLIFAFRSKHFKILETLIKLLFDFSRQFQIINGSLRVEWFEYHKDEPVFSTILYLDDLMKQIQRKYHPEQKEREEKRQKNAHLYKQVLDRIVCQDIDSQHQSKMVIFGRSDSYKNVFLEFVKQNIPYFSLNPLKRVEYVQFSSQKKEGNQSLATEFSNWLQICRSSRDMVPFFIVTQQDLRREREPLVIQSLKQIQKYYPLDNLIVVVIASIKSFRHFPRNEANMRFSAIFEKIESKRQMTDQNGIIVLERGQRNCHYLSISSQDMLWNMQRCETNITSFNFEHENHDLTMEIVEGFEVVLRPVISQKMNKWLRGWRTNKTLNDLIPEQILKEMKQCRDKQLFRILLKMSSVIKLTNQEKVNLLLYVHSYLRLHGNIKDSFLMKIIDTQMGDKRQWLRTNLWKKFEPHLQKLRKQFSIMSPDAFQLRQREVTMIALADNHNDMVAALQRLAANERRLGCHLTILYSITKDTIIAIQNFRTREEQQRVVDQLRAAVLNGLGKKLTLSTELNKMRLTINLSNSGYPLFRYLKLASHTTLGLVLQGQKFQEDLAILNISDSFQIEKSEQERPLRGGPLIILARHIKVSGLSLLLPCLKRLKVMLMATSYEGEHLLTSLPDSAKSGLTVCKPAAESSRDVDVIIGDKNSILMKRVGFIRHMAAIFKEMTHFL